MIPLDCLRITYHYGPSKAAEDKAHLHIFSVCVGRGQGLECPLISEKEKRLEHCL